MKLSKIIGMKGFSCATVYIGFNKVSVEIFFKESIPSKRIKFKRTKKFSSLEIDVDVRELPIQTVEHMGYKDIEIGKMEINM